MYVCVHHIDEYNATKNRDRQTEKERDVNYVSGHKPSYEVKRVHMYVWNRSVTFIRT